MILLAIATFIASILATSIGFGSGIILTPIFAMVLPLPTAVGVLSYYYFCTTIIRTFAFRQYLNWKIVLLVYTGAIPMVLLGTYLLMKINTSHLKIILGVFILFYIIWDLAKGSERFQIKLGTPQTLSTGCAYGLFYGMIGTANPITAALMMQLGLQKEAFIANMAACSVLLDLIKAGLLTQSSFVKSSDIPLMLAICLVGTIGTLIGKRLVIKQKYFRTAVLVMLSLVTIKLIVF